MKVIACEVLLREICLYAATSENICSLRFLPQGLHNEPDKLRRSLQDEIDRAEAEAEYDAIVLGYGLCSNGIVGVRARNTPTVVPRGHDCITILLGSKERYQDYFDSHKGIYWYSAGWIEYNKQPSRKRYEETLAEYRAKYGDENAEYLMSMEQSWYRQYSWGTYIDWGFPGSSRYAEFTKECAEFFGWSYDEVQGEHGLMKDLLHSAWEDSSKFLRVPPGMTIRPSYDDEIVAVAAQDTVREEERSRARAVAANGAPGTTSLPWLSQSSVSKER